MHSLHLLKINLPVYWAKAPATPAIGPTDTLFDASIISLAIPGAFLSLDTGLRDVKKSLL